MTFAQRQNRLTKHFSERIPVVKRRISVITPRSGILPEKLTGSQLVKKFPTFYGTRRLITAFTSARHLFSQIMRLKKALSKRKFFRIWRLYAVRRNIISIVKPTRCTNVSNLFYFGMTVHVLDGLSVRHQEFKTVHTATDICQTDTAVCLLASWQQYLFDTLVHLVGFTIENSFVLAQHWTLYMKTYVRFIVASDIILP